MGKIIAMFVLCLIMSLGVLKIMETIKTAILYRSNENILIICKPKSNQKNIEMLLRSLIIDAENMKTPKKTEIIIQTDNLEQNEIKIVNDFCVKHKNITVNEKSE